MQGSSKNSKNLALGVRLRNPRAVLTHNFDVKLDGLLNEPFDFTPSRTDSNTPRQIGHVGAETRGAKPDDDQVLHEDRS